MADNQNLEELRYDPGDFPGRRLHAVDRAIDNLAAAKLSIESQAASRIPSHSLVGTLETPKDMWQLHDQKVQAVPAPGMEYIAPGSQNVQPVYGSGSVDLESPEELLRKALQDVEAAHDSASQGDTQI